uniref:L-2,4-diaminobutyric acid acetyltransferase n=1 Tax=Candidatus Kentrum sp. DK TaxID=2126562 RepID=A0A450SU47_9GAMM|nr:MAG: diaminobutyrate acetyltransferase [Candidatus Kentron sp. DK]VFJ57505.1 MAG: diaminobutyrate acetyltransferase [Candidatus Kentron sp. DK]
MDTPQKLILPDTTVLLRPPRITDGTALWRLVRDVKVLDLNSPYAYFLLAEHFVETCVLAMQGDEIVGFVLAYIPPAVPDTLFVWQAGAAEKMRGRGLSKRMILSVLQRDSCRHLKALRSTVTPSNQASRALLRSVARAVGAELEIRPDHLRAEWFPEGGHEAESLFIISPIDVTNITLSHA